MKSGLWASRAYFLAALDDGIPAITAASIVAFTRKGPNLGLFKVICRGITTLKIIALTIMVLSLGWRIANTIT